ncbi:low molecular weight protein-tyrosine-phosphatase [Herbiconiux sp. L3-i23]|uniref:low molecular weight protein-tyrosine-phosphatase n=1 Tax=Herbiconiux sp. L3-i23 TaxID=2905871 RepID=UPI002066D394|nr:low molecular weight protein-tyrosine-phosphatase [Herbiconiux sp. L3-i23]BDI22671.1 low molecular weight protein-tyrosine-phosphatase [Herbiconiux sp. L3-i23]
MQLPEQQDPSGPYAITFVCTGNICRSPMGDVITRRLLAERGLEDRVAVTSSGTGGWHVGDGADPRTVAALHEHGYDGRPHRARQFDRSLFEDYDLILALDAGHVDALRALAPSRSAAERIHLLREFDPDARGDLDVPDPYYGDERDFDDVLVMVERSSRALVDALAQKLA